MFRLSENRRDGLFLAFLRCCALMAGGITLLVIVFLIYSSLPAFREVGVQRFFSDPSWHPSDVAAKGKFNLVPMLAGTLLVTLGAMVIATPVGVAAAVFNQYYAPKVIAKVYRRAIELLAGIPSVVFGFWGLVVLVPIINRMHPPGQSTLTAILILALMILPTIALIADGALGSVGEEMKQGAVALGLGRWAMVRGVMLPAAKSGIFTGILLGTGRAIGETLAVLMVCGNIVQIPGSVFEPVRTLTANIALEMGYAAGAHRSSLFVTGLILTLAVAVLVGLAEMIGRTKRSHETV